MFLGQLFFYEKELHKINSSVGAFSILDIEIAGIVDTFKNQLREIKDKNEMLLELKEAFINGYEKVLIDNSLFKTLDFWKRITSPVFKLNVAVGASNFQNEVNNWLEASSLALDLKKGLLTDGILTTSEQDYALYYGLHTLYIINNLLVGQDEVLDFDKLLTSKDVIVHQKELSENPQVLIVASVEVEPLIKDINGIFIRNSDSLEIVKESVIKSIKSNPEIRLILIDSKEKLCYMEILKLNLANILVTELQFSSTLEDSFFDEIVKKTLGINLTS